MQGKHPVLQSARCGEVRGDKRPNRGADRGRVRPNWATPIGLLLAESAGIVSKGSMKIAFASSSAISFTGTNWFAEQGSPLRSNLFERVAP